MKKQVIYTILYVTLILITISAASASGELTTFLAWSDDSTVKDISMGENAEFEWYVVSYYGGLESSVQLEDEEGRVLKTYAVTNGKTSDGGVEVIRASDYATTGTYYIRLSTMDNAERTGEDSITLHVIDDSEDHLIESVSVSAHPNQGTAPLTTTLACTATGGDGTLTYTWNFGDGSTSTNAVSTHTYQSIGNYTATCTVEDEDGDSGSASIIIQVGLIVDENIAPVAEFVWYPQSPREGEETQFISTSTDSDGNIASYAWNFGDGSTSSTQNPTHTFTTRGIYSVTLTVTDNEGASDSVQHIVIVQENIPDDNEFTTIVVNANPNNGIAPLYTQLTCQAIGGDTPITYTWFFGDGSTSNVQNPAHSYTTAGTYTAICIASDEDGDSISGNTTIVVTSAAINIAPVAEFVWYPQSPREGEETQFISTSTDSDGNIASYTWDFNNDGIGDSFGQTTSHTFTTRGIYLVTLRVTDNEGASDSVQHIITVQENTPDDKEFTNIVVNANPNNGIAPLYTQLTCQAIGGDTPITYSWNFGDGSTSNVQNPAHSYTTAGTYTATCTATDADGDTISGSTTIVVSSTSVNNPPVARFIYHPNMPEENELVVFDAGTSSDSDGNIVSYEWDFNNDGTWDATGKFATHGFAHAPGAIVTLRVTDDDGASDTETAFVPVSKDEPIINIIASCNPDVVQGHREYCSAHVEDMNGFDVNSASVTFRYVYPNQYLGEVIGTCITNFKGDCHISELITKPVGDYLVNATTYKTNTISGPPAQTGFKVWSERYDIIGLEVYADDAYTQVEDVFYRGDAMYVSFGIYDMINNNIVCDDALVKEVFLRVNNLNPLYFTEDSLTTSSKNAMITRLETLIGGTVDCSYEYMINNIPLTDDYLGDGRVFAFAFNFNDNSAGQSSKVITVLNNPVEVIMPASFNIHKSYESDSESIIIDFRAYVSDLETADNDMIYQVQLDWNQPVGMLIADEISAGVFRITATSGFIGSGLLTLRVDDTDGSIVVDDTEIIVSVDSHDIGPVAIIQSANNAYVNRQIVFDGRNSYDPDGSIVQYAWDFGDGSTSSVQNPAHSYTAAGTYLVSLTVWDNDGNSDMASKTIIIIPDTRLPACSDGKDNDADGLIDMNDPGCSYPGKDDEGNIASSGPEKGLKIRNIEVVSDTLGLNKAVAGDIVVAEITVENFAGEKLDNIRIGFSIPELGIKQKSSQFTLNDGKRETKKILVYIPFDVAPGNYYTEITVADGDIRRSTHGLINIIQ